MIRMLRSGAIAACLLATVTAAPAMADKRVALVIGNGSYANARTLDGPAADAAAMAAALDRLDFEVIEAKDVTQAGFGAALFEFERRSAEADVALFYFAGLGMQIGGSNVLLAADAKVANPYLIDADGMRLERILGLMTQADIAIALIDASRPNPLAEALRARVGDGADAIGLAPGLARLEQPFANSLVAFSAAPGTVTPDAASPFTDAVVREIAAPNTGVATALERAAEEVAGATGGRQQPLVISTLTDDFALFVEKALADTTTTDDLPAAAAPAGIAAAPVLGEIDRLNIAADTVLNLARSLDTADGYRLVIQSYPGTAQARAAETALAALAPAEDAAPATTATAPVAKLPGGTEATERDLGLDRDAREQVQGVLTAIGYDTRGVDGQFGPGTRGAIRQLQAAIGHEATGFLGADEHGTILAAADTHRVKSMMRGQTISFHRVEDLPPGADPRLAQVVDAVRSKPIRFRVRDGTLYVVVAGMTRFEAARRLALQAGGDLAIIDSAEENAFIFGMIKDVGAFWRFGADRFSPGGYFVNGPLFGLVQAGDVRSSREGWTWVDGSPVGYTNWFGNGGQPNEYDLFEVPGGAAFGGQTGKGKALAEWQDYQLLKSTLPAFIIEIPPAQDDQG